MEKIEELTNPLHEIHADQGGDYQVFLIENFVMAGPTPKLFQVEAKVDEFSRLDL